MYATGYLAYERLGGSISVMIELMKYFTNSMFGIVFRGYFIHQVGLVWNAIDWRV